MILRALSLPLVSLLLFVSCSSRTSAPLPPRDSETVDGSAEPRAEEPLAPKAIVPAAAPTDGAPTDIASWLRAHLPKGGSVAAEDPLRLLHRVSPGETHASIAAAYLELTEIYDVKDLAAALGKRHPALRAGATIDIPSPLTRAPRDPREERLGWPEDKVLRGVFVTGSYAQVRWVDTLDKLAARGLNAVVLDSKDYMGPVNYPTRAKIALEAGAAERAPIPDLARAIRFAHWRGIRVILRIPCFHDPIADRKLKDSRLSIRHAKADIPIHIEWIDPVKPEAQEYAVELAREGVEAGADEIQLDYVRFPVHLGQSTAKLPDPKDRSKIIRDFVRRVRDVTRPNGVMLSLDLFGVAATGERSDIDRLGQDIATVGAEADAISPMVYPSHYSRGYMGFDEPGDHPEIVGVGTKAAARQLQAAHANTVVRSWIQAFPWRTKSYGAKYVVDQAASAEANGGKGWLMWSPACEYSAVWRGFPPKADADAASKKAPAPSVAPAKHAPLHVSTAKPPAAQVANAKK